MAISVGEIGLDLVVNQKGFNKQIAGIQNTAKKAAGMLASVLAIKGGFDLTKQCLDLGSDLAEVQNVVDVTFPHMTAQIDSFAKNAAEQFGLSETMAKKFSGTFGSMAEAFGFSEKAAATMATTLTGLAGDVASFYNIDQEEAYTKLKAVFSGETEVLKDLGIVMTQTALDSYAMANGFGKTVQKMSEAEKVALRYAFVQDQLTNATGDFARTSDSWANQIRILSLQFDSLKATIGQGLINVFSPILVVVNGLIKKLISCASVFKAFTELITGKKSQDNGVAQVATAAGKATKEVKKTTGATNSLTKATKKAGAAAKKAAKNMLGLASFDELNNFSSKSQTKSSDDDKGTSTTVPDIGQSVDFGTPAKQGGKEVEGLTSKLQAAINAAKVLGGLFLKGFKIGIGDISVLSSIKKQLESIKQSFRNIINNKEIQASLKNCVSSVVFNLGKLAGSVTSVGLTIADNLTGGISKYLQQHKNDLIGDLIAMFNICGKYAEIVGNFATALANIATVFRSDQAKQITADLINIFADSVSNITLLGLKLGRDFLNMLAKPFIDNKDQLKTALQNIINPLSVVIGSISGFVNNTWNKIQTVYDGNVKPLLDSLSTGISEICTTILNGFNTYIVPVLNQLAKQFKSVMEKNIQPAANAMIYMFGSLCDAVKDLWQKWLQPFLNWVAKNIMPLFAGVIECAGQAVINAFGMIGEVIKGVATVFTGIITIIQGIINGNWKTVWEGCKIVISGIWDGITGVFRLAWETIKGIFSVAVAFFKGIWSGIKSVFSGVATFFKSLFVKAYKNMTDKFTTAAIFFLGVWTAIKNVFAAVKEFFQEKFTAAYNNIKNAFSAAGAFFKGIWSNIKSVFAAAGTWFKEKFVAAYNNVKNAFSAAGTFFKGVWSNIKNAFPSIATWFKGKFDTAYSKVTGAFSKTKAFFKDIWSDIKSPFTNVADWFKDKFSKAWEGVKNVFSTGGKIFDGIKDGIASTFKTIVNGLIGGINKIIKKPFDAINGMLNKIREVGVAGAKPFKGLWDKNPLSVPKIPPLANGGFVKANTPQLAMIGDNRHQGEVVSPEDKLQKMADEAAARAGVNTANALIPVIERLCNAIIDLENRPDGHIVHLEGVSSSGLYKLVKEESAKERKRGVRFGI